MQQNPCKKEFCTQCGKEKKPLLSTLYCPNDCDRIPENIDPEDEITARIVMLQCPSCNSFDVKPYDNWLMPSSHCIDCGKVF